MISQHYKGYDDLIARIDDLLFQFETYHKSVATNFLTEEEIEVCKRYLGKQYEYTIDGGYEGFLRGRLIFSYDNDSYVVGLECNINNKFVKLSHRDVLGAIMSLNIERDMIGDIFVNEDSIVFFTNPNIADYLIMSLRRIHNVNVAFDYLTEKFSPIINYRIIKDTISSARIDVIVASLCHTNRTNAQRLIKNKMVSVNHQTIEDCAKLCNNNCTISIRKYGRFEFLGVIKTTKKDRLLVEFKQFI